MQDYERKGYIRSKVVNKEYEDNYDNIFRKKKEEECPCTNDEKDVKEEPE